MATKTPNYDINPNDKRLTDVKADEKAELNEADIQFGTMTSNAEKYINSGLNDVEKWEKKQSELQQQRTDFTIEQINQQKEQAKQDYTKEQSGAYVDWQKQSNQYGANAEQIAAQGMTNTGYSESSQVSMYNTYQNRLATAREVYSRAVLNYDNAIKDAQLQNNAALAEIAFKALEKQLELGLEGLTIQNDLLMAEMEHKQEVKKFYHDSYQDVLKQINTENALAEEVRQYNASKELEEAKLRQQKEIADAQLAEEKRQFDETMAYNKSKSSGGGTINNTSSGDSGKQKEKASNVGTPKIDRNSPAAREANQKAKQDDAKQYFNELIKSGASKSKVANEITQAYVKGEITAKEMRELQSIFTPRGVQYN